MIYLLLFILGLFIGQIRTKTLMREEKPYLIRITLLKCRYFSLKIHKALMSDPATPHDHPWNYYSLILWGGYWEHTILPNWDTIGYQQKIWYKPGNLLIRRGNQFHKLEIPKGEYCISLILTTKKWRDWGFYDFYKGWISHKEKTYK